ncbi:MAG: hypothetical protein IT281_00460 [Ignavibacteria bacterium]|nr:hypothetical protein [Ignavibacteria bacterium]MCC7157989.1 hypothetical protein [Ignavibacteria bacterium]
MTSEEMYSGLVCPVGKHPLSLDGGHLVCENCGASFPINDGIPELLIEDARLPEGINSIADLKCMKEKNSKK